MNENDEGGVDSAVAVVELPKATLTAEAAWKRLDPSVRIHVIRGRVEDVVIPEHVDVIVSEPLGFLLVHERMLEAFVTARDRFLGPGGRLMPSMGTIVFAPVTDPELWAAQKQKAAFWANGDFHGVDLRALEEDALEEYFSQAVVGTFGAEALLVAPITGVATHVLDFGTVTLAALRNFEVPLAFEIRKTAVMHGLGCWFDTDFVGSTETVTLSTAPDAPWTHWYQCRLLLRHPIAVNATQRVQGSIRFDANDRLSYDLTVHLHLVGTDVQTTQTIRLDDQMYHYLNHPTTETPGGGL